MGCGITTVKYLLFIFNLVFALCGLAILIAGAITYANIDEVNHALDGINVSASPVALIVIGSIVFVIAFYGCCGAIRESHCMIVTFAVFLLVILIAEIAIGIVAFVNRDGWDDAIQKNVKDMFDRYDSTTNSTRNEVDAIQKSLECCGIDGSTFWLGHLGGLPRSCCIKPDGVCDFSVIKDSSVVFQSGCKSKIIELLQGIGLILGVLAVVVGVVEITGVIFALCLASSIKNRERRGRA